MRHIQSIRLNYVLVCKLWRDLAYQVLEKEVIQVFSTLTIDLEKHYCVQLNANISYIIMYQKTWKSQKKTEQTREGHK